MQSSWIFRVSCSSFHCRWYFSLIRRRICNIFAREMCIHLPNLKFGWDRSQMQTIYRFFFYRYFCSISTIAIVLVLERTDSASHHFGPYTLESHSTLTSPAITFLSAPYFTIFTPLFHRPSSLPRNSDFLLQPMIFLFYWAVRAVYSVLSLILYGRIRL